ncbi:MAG: hypothetical protein BWY48_00046 [Parcubacteria group bacterium ADurb.Bin305]|jgi:hypothetical protein|nr:hypothetical protein [Candidatus Paceibacterota bacterium]MDD3434313.1 hypothetical protein [Candidatus Paceibacterota bacterium]OQA44490.1 MAG: hypothetical protein BWY48_00046 [Parcubacteria group bacterium ADurb.Bin305]
MTQAEQFSKILDKITELKKGGNPLDLSSKEDLAIAIMNLISLEEHFFFTYSKTKDDKYLTLLTTIREERKVLLKEIVKNPEGEIWCISKHLLAASMRLMEVGTKKLNEGNSQSAKDLFDKSYTLWNIFWGLNLELIEVKDINSYTNSESEEKIIFQNDNDPNKDKAGSLNVWNKLGDMLKKILDCCKE